MVTASILQGDCRETIGGLEPGSIQMVLTSPPYFGLRDYNHPDQIGKEENPGVFVSSLVNVFQMVHRVLADDGTLWVNIGDSYGRDGSLQGIPWRMAFALQDSGWIVRQEIIWAKPSPMPESVQNRCTRSHEFLFMLSKQEKYFYDAQAISTPHTEVTLARWSKGGEETKKTKYRKEKPDTAVGNLRNGSNPLREYGANRRDVWTINTESSNLKHQAMMPKELASLCIQAGCPEGGTVLDPFGGAGTTALAATLANRNAVLCELNPEYAQISASRIRNENMFAKVQEKKL